MARSHSNSSAFITIPAYPPSPYMDEVTGDTRLISYTKKGEFKLIQALIDNPASHIDINARNFAGNSAVMEAAAAGHISLVYYLAVNGNADVTLRNTQNKSALDLAAANDQTGVVRYLASVFITDKESRAKALQEAKPHSDTANFLESLGLPQKRRSVLDDEEPEVVNVAAPMLEDLPITEKSFLNLRNIIRNIGLFLRNESRAEHAQHLNDINDLLREVENISNDDALEDRFESLLLIVQKYYDEQKENYLNNSNLTSGAIFNCKTGRHLNGAAVSEKYHFARMLGLILQTGYEQLPVNAQQENFASVMDIHLPVEGYQDIKLQLRNFDLDVMGLLPNKQKEAEAEARLYAEELKDRTDKYSVDEESVRSKNLTAIITGKEINEFYKQVQVSRFLFGRTYGKQASQLFTGIDLTKVTPNQVIQALEVEFDKLRQHKTRGEFIDFLNKDQKHNHYARTIGLVLRYAHHTSKDRVDEFDSLKLPKEYAKTNFRGQLADEIFVALDKQQEYLDYQNDQRKVVLARR